MNRSRHRFQAVSSAPAHKYRNNGDQPRANYAECERNCDGFQPFLEQIALFADASALAFDQNSPYTVSNVTASAGKDCAGPRPAYRCGYTRALTHVRPPLTANPFRRSF